MPNLTDLLEAEDLETIRSIAWDIPTTRFVTYDVSDIAGSGFEWTADGGTWTNQVLLAAGGYQLAFDTGTGPSVKFEITENAHRFTSNVNGLFLDNEQVLVSDTSITSGSDAITNLVSLTDTEYAGIGTKGTTTLYIVTGVTPKIYLGDTVIL